MNYTPEDLRIFEIFTEVPDSELQWLIDHCEYKEYEEGTKIFAPEDAADFMYLIMEGEALFYMMQNGERRGYGTAGAGVITGLLPYSRMKVARGNGVALRPIKTLVLHRSQMRQLTVDCRETTAAYTEWLPGAYMRDLKGFLLTGRDLVLQEEFRKEWPLERDPFTLETPVPGVFAAGDVRSGAMNRVASAVGEGAMSISLVHQYLSEN